MLLPEQQAREFHSKVWVKYVMETMSEPFRWILLPWNQVDWDAYIRNGGILYIKIK